ncbi:MAG: hypothetical protein IPH93_08690 [Saprospiraceae bacterium]|nr:hypothetical protein [Saprospiraceae bacterium]MBK7810572.1 hypothetical protein [Saprospiraceae bacterium]MBK9630163.1 hypothetical protein [Saprospiraceae bacterium]
MIIEPDFGKKDLFCQPAWVNCLFPEDKIIYHQLQFKNSHLYSAFIIYKKYFWNFLKDPKFSPYNIYIEHHVDELGSYQAYEKEVELLKMLREKCSNYSLVKCKFHPQIMHVSSASLILDKFYYAPGAKLEYQGNGDNLWDKIFRNARNHINHSEKEGIEIKEVEPHQVSKIFAENKYYKEHGFSQSVLVKLYQLFKPLGILRLSAAISDQQILAFTLTIQWQNETFLILNIINKNDNHRAANTALLWENIQYSLNQKCDFNFDGSMNQAIMRRFKSFSAETFSYCYGEFCNSKLISIFR